MSVFRKWAGPALLVAAAMVASAMAITSEKRRPARLVAIHGTFPASALRTMTMSAMTISGMLTSQLYAWMAASTCWR